MREPPSSLSSHTRAEESSSYDDLSQSPCPRRLPPPSLTAWGHSRCLCRYSPALLSPAAQQTPTGPGGGQLAIPLYLLKPGGFLETLTEWNASLLCGPGLEGLCRVALRVQAALAPCSPLWWRTPSPQEGTKS